MIKNVFLIVEGVTEELFYKNVFSSYFEEIHFTVTKMPLKRTQSKADDKGGNVSFKSFSDIIKGFIRSASHCQKIIFIYDYYKLNKTFTDHFNGSEITVAQKIDSIRSRMITEIDNPKFFVFLQIHEFEAYLFSNPEIVGEHFADNKKGKELFKMLEDVNHNPELINDNKETSPSNRILKLFPKYGKTTDGVTIARKIGIEKIKEMCPYFREFSTYIKN